MEIFFVARMKIKLLKSSLAIVLKKKISSLFLEYLMFIFEKGQQRTFLF